MSKPIFIIKLPSSASANDLDHLQSLSDVKFKDYHTIVCTSNVESIEFEVFYEKDFNEVKYEELKQIVLNTVKN